MKVLVLGASGATGRLVVSELADRNIQVKALVRSTATFPKELLDSVKVKVVTGSVNDFSVSQLGELISDCDAVVSCLGHNISFKGLFGRPRRLVRNAVRNTVQAMEESGKKRKFILMSTTAYTNRKAGEKNSFGEKIIFTLLKLLLPPHADNMTAGDFLIHSVGDRANAEWVAVRPDSLFNEPEPGERLVVETKLRSPMFDPGKTSRITVARFMSDLLSDEFLWNKWRSKTPVLYNRD